MKTEKSKNKKLFKNRNNNYNSISMILKLSCKVMFFLLPSNKFTLKSMGLFIPGHFMRFF